MNIEEAAALARSLPGVTDVEIEPQRTVTYSARLLITGPPLGESRRYIYEAMEQALADDRRAWQYGVLAGEEPGSERRLQEIFGPREDEG